MGEPNEQWRDRFEEKGKILLHTFPVAHFVHILYDKIVKQWNRIFSPYDTVYSKCAIANVW